MKEIINSIGTLFIIVSLTVAIILISSMWVKVLAGAGLAFTMFAHDDYMKFIWKEEANKETDKYNNEVDNYNTEIDKFNE